MTAVLLVTICFVMDASVATQPEAPEQPAKTTAANTSPEPANSTARVPVPEPSEKALSYYRSGNVLWVINTVWGLLVPAAFLFTGFSARIRDFAQRLGRKWFFTVALYFIIYLVINFVINLPLSWYEDFVREHAYGLSNQTFGKWLGDALKGLLVGALIGSLVIWVPYLLLSYSPRRWWLYTGLLSLPFMILMMLILPIWIAPLFNKFGPMKDQALEAKILALAERAGIAGSRVFEVDMSTDTKKVNAYVAGLGNTKRIVLWDTLLAKLDESEVLFVMGHEMGHYVLGHIWQGILIGSVFVTGLLYAIHRTAGWLIDRYKARFGFDRLADIASLPLIILLFSLAGLITGPLGLAYSRHCEHQADRFGLEITQNNHAAASAFAKLQIENLGVPRPGLLYKTWRASHPPVGERIDFANEYRPWEKNQPLVYGKYFRDPK